MPKPITITWLAEPEPQDFPAALSYLLLLYPKKQAASFIKDLKAAALKQFKAKDIFRASGLPLLPVTNSHVQQDERKIRSGRKLSPLLLVRDPSHAKVIIADGYHRLCAVYSFDEDAVIPCLIA